MPLIHNKRLLENGSYRLIESGGFRLLEDYTISDLSAVIKVISHSDLSAVINVIPYSDLSATVKVISHSDLSASIFVDDEAQRLYGKIYVDDEAQRLYGEIYVIPYSDLSAKISVYHAVDLYGKVKIVYPGTTLLLGSIYVIPYTDLEAEIYVIPYSDLSAKITVTPPTVDLYATINVLINHVDLYGVISVTANHVDLSASIFVDDEAQRLYGKITVYQRADLNGTIDVVIPPSQLLTGTIKVISHVDFYGELKVLQDSFEELFGEIKVIRPPLDVVITADIVEAVWQDNDIVNFAWTDAEDLVLHLPCFYFYQINQIADYEVSAADFLSGSATREKQITLEDAGHWYFHVRAKNSSAYSPHTAHFHVMYNHIPSAPQPPFLVDEQTSPAIVNRTRPLFKWGFATDADRIDILSYRIEIANDIGFTDIHANISGIVYSQGSLQYRLEPQYKVSVGTYYWRVFATDGKQEGIAGDVSTFTVSPAFTDLDSELWIGYAKNKYLLGKIDIVPYNNVDAVISIIPYDDLFAKASVYYASDLNAKITVQAGSFLYGSITVDDSAQRLYGKISISHYESDYRLYGAVNVTVVNQLLYGQVFVVPKIDLNGKINVINKYLSDEQLNGKIWVGYLDEVDLNGVIEVTPYVNFYGELKVLQDSFEELFGKITVVAITPLDVVITADIVEAVWQDNDIVNFAWTDAEDLVFHIPCIYFYQINQIADYEVSIADFLSGSATREKQVIFDEAGHWYFHVRAKNSNGFYAINTSHFHVMYNHIPGKPQPPLLADGNVSPAIVNSSRPIFDWNQALDEDELDIVRYRLLIANDVDFTNIHANINEITVLDYKLAKAYMLVPETYYWKVFATDGKQEGLATDVNVLEVVPVYDALNAKLTIGEFDTSNLIGEISINRYVNLHGGITVQGVGYENLNARLRVVRYNDIDLRSNINIIPYIDLSATISIIRYSDIYGKIKIIDVPGYNILFAKIKVQHESAEDLNARIRVRYGSNSDIYGRLVVFTKQELYGKINVFIPNSDLNGEIKVLQDSYKRLDGVITVTYAYAGNITLSCNVAEGVWQEENNIIFTWLPVQAGQNQISGYLYKLDKNANTAASPSWILGGGLSASFNLENYDGASSYYFHICAVDSIGRMGNVRHFNVKYNHKPSAPQEPLTINGIDSVAYNPIIARNAEQNFAWNHAIDIDLSDIQYYTIEVANNNSFENVIITIGQITKTNYNIDLQNRLTMGYYYWRVKSFDGHEYGAWSVTGCFFVNTPPTIPTDLLVIGS